MWGSPEEPPDDTEVAGSSETVPDPCSSVKEICEDNRSQLETFKDIMLKNKNELKKKEQELQEYASKLSQIKSRTKRSRRSKDSDASSVETTPKLMEDVGTKVADEDTVDEISQARTPKAKSSLLQRKLAENRKIFEQRSKEMTESKRAVEEKVEAIRQQMDQTDLTLIETQRDQLIVTPVRPVLISPQIVSPMDLQVGPFQDKDNKIAELSNRILELEAGVIDLQDSLREKDSVIDSKTRAVTLMSADLSKKGKSTLDTLEDTKDEMRTMQENFVLIETSLRGKNDNLLEQLQERNDRVTDLEATINRYEQETEEKRLAEIASASLSRKIADTLADTKNEMRTMQENFVLIETSLREKNDNLLRQLEARDTKLAEAEDRIYKFESGAGTLPSPEIPDLLYKIDRLEQSNVALQDEKYELQKSIAALQEKIVTREATNGNGLIAEKDNRIAELENLIEELKNSNQLLEEESKAELVKQVDELSTKNDELRCKIDDLERLSSDLEIEKNELRSKIPEDSGTEREDAIFMRHKKELDDLNKSMIKLKAQHKGKLRNLQKQLESFKMVSDANAELVKLGNQVALLEEEKGNLQLSLVDFDELKASAGDWQDRIADLESRVSTQANDIQAHVEAIAILENQKLDLMQDLHNAKQEISALEAENAESENLRVTAEMKIVDIEEQLENFHKLHNESVINEPPKLLKDTSDDLYEKIENLTQENSELLQRIAKLEEKPSSEAGSTESFETIHDDRNELLKRIESLSARNIQLEDKLSKYELEMTRTNVATIESLETINDDEKSELVKKIALLSRENSDLVTRLNKFEEKGSSDTGSTESFEKIPEHVDVSPRIDILIRENNELVIKLTKLEEKMENLSSRSTKDSDERNISEDTMRNNERLNNLIRENSELVIELTKMREKFSRIVDDKDELEKIVDNAKQHEASVEEETSNRIKFLTVENQDLIIKLVKLEEKNSELRENLEKIDKTESQFRKDEADESNASSATMMTITSLEIEIEKCRKVIAEQTSTIDELRTKIMSKDAELDVRSREIEDCAKMGLSVEKLQSELTESFGIIEEWKYKCEIMERRMEILESGKMAIEEGLEILQNENKILLEDNRLKDTETRGLKQELDDTIVNFANRLDEERAIAIKQEQEITKLRELLLVKDQELHEKYSMLQTEMINIDNLQDQLNESRAKIEENEGEILSLRENMRKLKDEEISREQRVSTLNAEIMFLNEEISSKVEKEAKNLELLDDMKNTINNQIKENENLQKIMENSSDEIQQLRSLLIEKSNNIASLVDDKLSLEDKIRDTTIAKDEAMDKLESLQNIIDDNVKYEQDLKVELSDAYRTMELLKIKHSDDLNMQNQRLEDLIVELEARKSECEILRKEFTSKEAKYAEDIEEKIMEIKFCRERIGEMEILVGQNFTERTKFDMEQRMKELEDKFFESEANVQTQLQKRKILAANLKKKSAQCDEFEAKAAKFETEASEFKAKIADTEARARILEARVEELESVRLELEARARDFEAKATELEAKVFELEAIIANIEPRAVTNEARNIELVAKIVELEANVAILEPRAATYEAKATKLEIETAKYETEAREYVVRAAELEARVVELESSVSEHEKRVLESETRATEIESRAAKFELEADEFRTRASYYEAKIVEMESKIAILELRKAEIEEKAREFEEKWLSEKSEKEASNITIRENDLMIIDKNETILRLEERLGVALSEASLSNDKAEMLSNELTVCREKIAAIASQMETQFEEMEKLRQEIVLRTSELSNERTLRENIITNNETRNVNKIADDTEFQRILEESKEKARELGVRMQVMESEYIEQLNTIQMLRTENGMLLSKQAQINEKLENIEKESYERKITIDRMERETIERDTEILRLGETTRQCVNEETSNDDDKLSCDNCEKCRTVVQALEAKLQERDAEIENLDNELANSIGNFVHMRESLRVSDLNNQSTSRSSRTHEENREITELVYQYNALTARNAELSEKLRQKINDNDELNEKIASLEAINLALRERTHAAENELLQARDVGTETTTMMTSNVDPLDHLLGDYSQKSNNEPLNVTRDEQKMSIERHDETIESAILKIQQLESYNNELTREFENLTRSRNSAETEIVTLRDDSARLKREILQLRGEIEKYRSKNLIITDNEANDKETSASSNLFAGETNDAPRLFDAARIFGPSVIPDIREQREITELREILANKDLEIIDLSREIKRLSDENVELESRALKADTRGAEELEISPDEIELSTNDQICGKLENLQVENEQLVRSFDVVCSALSEIVQDHENDEKIRVLSNLQIFSPVVQSRIMEIVNFLKLMINERTKLFAELDSCKRRIIDMEEESKNFNDPARIQELEERVDKLLRERDVKQLQVNDLARSLESMQESIEKASSNEEIRLRNLQASLDSALSENDQLKIQLELSLLRDNREIMIPLQMEQSRVGENLEKIDSKESKVGEEIVETGVSAQSSKSEITIVPDNSWDEETRHDDDVLSWNPEDAQFADYRGREISGENLMPNLERRLNARIAELEDTIRDHSNERVKLTDEIKQAHLRSGKIVKKLKELKIQNDSLQQQLKIQRVTSDFCDLDKAIEEELKSQIFKLERELDEAKEEMRKLNLERENYIKKIDVLSSANERLVEMKERQDMEMEVLKIRTKDLSDKLQTMDWHIRDASVNDSANEKISSISSSSLFQEQDKSSEIKLSETETSNTECLCKKYKNDIDELRDEIEALAAENEQLQKLLEEQRVETRLTRDSELNVRLSECQAELRDLSRSKSEIMKELDDTRNNYQLLTERCDVGAKNSEQKILALEESCDAAKREFDEKTLNFEAEILRMRDEMNSASVMISELREKLKISNVENEELLEDARRHDATMRRLEHLEDSMTELTVLLNSRVQEVAELKREIQRLKSEKIHAIETFEDFAQNHTLELSVKSEEARRCVHECESRLHERSSEIADLREKLSDNDHERAECRADAENMRREIERLSISLNECKLHRESLQSELASKEQEFFVRDNEATKYIIEIQRLGEIVENLEKSLADTRDEANRRICEFEERETSLKRSMMELTTRESDSVANLYREISAKDDQLAKLQQTVVNLEEKIREIATRRATEERIIVERTSEIGESLDESLRIERNNEEIRDLRDITDKLRNELSRKNEEIEDYRYQLSESTYPSIIQALQDQVNMLYEEKAKLEEKLTATVEVSSKEHEIDNVFTENSRYQSRQLKSSANDVASDESTMNKEGMKILKDENEIRALRLELDESSARLRNLYDRYEIAEMETNELKLHLATRENNIEMLQQSLSAIRQECELLRNALAKDSRSKEIDNSSIGQNTIEQSRSNELDIALYMLHQRDVKCEELTHELMQLLEERDTLQLRLSNAIRINEELRRSLPIVAQTSEIIRDTGDAAVPLVEKPSPSRSIGPVEIAKEAIDTPSEEKIALDQKLSQLHNMGHRRDVRLMDDRELRHNQQMSLLAHRDVLSTLPPEAAARLVNANYTLSRDVQSQSSILMNWLWGKSTPKVVHM